MARVHHSRAVVAAPAASRHRMLTTRKPSYKVVLENVIQEKKKMVTVVSFNTQAPSGYTFIPAGDPQVTNRCKQLAREDGAKVFVVSTTKHKHAENLSHQVHRIGYHFPSLVVERACESLGVDLDAGGQVIRQQQIVKPAQSKKRRVGNGRSETSKADLSQATIDTQAREAIRDLFPNIPDEDCSAIITRAFEKNKNRVGTAAELTLPRRVQLAVVAHIRHNYTDYDKLIRQSTWLSARAAVEQASLDKLASWRGDDEDKQNAMEEILREVIVIPDDDHDDGVESHPSRKNPYDDGEGSIEIISSDAVASDMETRPIDYGQRRTKSAWQDDSEPESANEGRFLGHGQYIFEPQDQRNQRRIERVGMHRHNAWEQALSRRRNQPSTSFASVMRAAKPIRDQAIARPDQIVVRESPHRAEDDSRSISNSQSMLMLRQRERGHIGDESPRKKRLLQVYPETRQGESWSVDSFKPEQGSCLSIMHTERSQVMISPRSGLASGPIVSNINDRAHPPHHPRLSSSNENQLNHRQIHAPRRDHFYEEVLPSVEEPPKTYKHMPAHSQVVLHDSQYRQSDVQTRDPLQVRRPVESIREKYASDTISRKRLISDQRFPAEAEYRYDDRLDHTLLIPVGRHVDEFRQPPGLDVISRDQRIMQGMLQMQPVPEQRISRYHQAEHPTTEYVRLEKQEHAPPQQTFQYQDVTTVGHHLHSRSNPALHDSYGSQTYNASSTGAPSAPTFRDRAPSHDRYTQCQVSYDQAQFSAPVSYVDSRHQSGHEPLNVRFMGSGSSEKRQQDTYAIPPGGLDKSGVAAGSSRRERQVRMEWSDPDEMHRPQHRTSMSFPVNRQDQDSTQSLAYREVPQGQRFSGDYHSRQPQNASYRQPDGARARARAHGYEPVQYVERTEALFRDQALNESRHVRGGPSSHVGDEGHYDHEVRYAQQPHERREHEGRRQEIVVLE